MDKIAIKTPAKINIGLYIVGKRDDGYHDLETIFYPLLLADIIEISKSKHDNFISDSEELNQKQDNLIAIAKKLIVEKIKKRLSVEIKLEKKIPIGGGLGGGSSNAAGVLLGLNRLFNLKLDHNELSQLALQLGSDVPFFLNPIPSFAESRGEKLKAIPFQLNYPILIINPGINVSTSWAFSKIKSLSPESGLKELFSTSPDFKTIREKVKNDFEEIVFKEYPGIAEIKSDLYKLGAEFALMTGSGSSVFGIFNNMQKAQFAQDHFSRKCFTYLNNPFTTGSIT